ncbi:chemotaxis protein CheA [Alicyclobacillus sp. SO9]|uniref:chemotaxis protein CheA n=1 Tax=Alicyclobacillus sp. SO9 TaxID=2665646 RepID=UPI0018E725BA|nr:chemotaxis protein CheA [Alicyclobacillus sp. SO9]QQE79270.1 chemotaxis protein CheA [Alicyclobacillus sp. SO9]
MSSEYLSMFIDETRENLQSWSDGILEMEQSQDDAQVPTIFRAAHTIKGMAMTMGFQRMGEITHRAENLLDGIRQGSVELSTDVVNVLLQSLDVLEQLLDGIEETQVEPETDVRELVQAVERLANGQTQAPKEVSATAERQVQEISVDTSGTASAQLQDSIESIARKAIEKGYQVYDITIGFATECIMPMARWAQVLQGLNQDELLSTNPDAAVLETGEHTGDISFVLATKDDIEAIGKRVSSVTEVEIRVLQQWTGQAGLTSDQGSLLPQEKLSNEDHILTAVEAALSQQKNVYEAGVRLYPDTAMKSARLYMLFEAVGGQDRLLYTSPSMADIDNEKLDTDVLFIMWSDKTEEAVRAMLESVSSVAEVAVRNWTADSTTVAEGTADAAKQKSEGASSSKSKRKASSTVRVDTEKLDVLMNLFSELVIDKTRLQKIEQDLGHTELGETVAHMSRISNELQEIVMSIRMVPVSTVFHRFPRMVRDTSQKLDKQVSFEMTGEETELDRTVVEEIGDPIMHMLRNALDHGLESSQDRISAGKPVQGHIFLRAYSSGNSVFIEVEDDGGGINRDAVLSRAIERGIVEDGRAMSDEQVYQLLFASGFSTAETVTDLSGRGVGLDVVKSKIESLGGRIEIQSELGKGSKFIIQLPMTLAIMQGLMVSVGGSPYLLPLSSVSEVEADVSVQTVSGQEVFKWRDEVVPLVRVNSAFGMDSGKDQYTIVVHKGNRKLGLAVDDVLGQSEVVLKPLGSRLREVQWFSGGTILGDGTVALIMDPNSFFENAV